MLNIAHILHPTDFSESSNQALKYACSFATQFGAELHLLNIVSDTGIIAPPIAGYIPPDFHEQRKKYAIEELSEYPEKVLNISCSVVRNVEDGVPFVEIIRYAKSNNIDLIVMGTHGYSGVKHLIMGSVAENVVRKAHCPVLTVHPENYEFEMP
jgi:nucleotide-binding universal stress UspA family protein